MRPGVFITFDVECSMGGAWQNPDFRPVSPDQAVWGRYGDRQLGLPLITDILAEHGLPATFFVEAFMAEQGHPGQAEPICRYLLDRGHDVQLHIHPCHKFYAMKLRGEPFPATDELADLEPAAQRAFLAEGAERIERWTGRPPVAFRAGNMAASEETLRQLAAVGLRIDSSYTFVYVGGQCRFAPQEPYNGSKWYGDVLELALSGFRQPRLPGVYPAKPLDLMGISFAECRDAIRSICTAGADAVMILHNFSLLKVRNVQYEGGRANRVVTQRFRRLCKWLAAGALPVYTFSDVAAAVANKTYEARHRPPCMLAHPRGMIRKAVQAWNNCYWT
jgi:peptidoglycan/xylan/chitin deacetylase (PgdA/CDA1 family)